MSSKDYYKILEVNPAASDAEIKKSYRRLAMKYHPDKNFDNKLSEVKFKEVQEAYDVLSDELKKQKYNHKQFDEKHGLDKKPPTDLPDAKTILLRSSQLRKKVMFLDPHRLDTETLSFKIEQILSLHNLNVLKKENDQKINNLIADEILNMCTVLKYDDVRSICADLKSIAETETELHHKIDQFLKKQKAHDYWNRYHFVAALIIVMLFCYLILKLST